MSGNMSALLLNILIIAAIFVLNYFYQKNNFVFLLKCICSAAFALLGIINLLFAIGAEKEKLEFAKNFLNTSYFNKSFGDFDVQTTHKEEPWEK